MAATRLLIVFSSIITMEMRFPAFAQSSSFIPECKAICVTHAPGLLEGVVVLLMLLVVVLPGVLSTASTATWKAFSTRLPMGLYLDEAASSLIGLRMLPGWCSPKSRLLGDEGGLRGTR